MSPMRYIRPAPPQLPSTQPTLSIQSARLNLRSGVLFSEKREILKQRETRRSGRRSAQSGRLVRREKSTRSFFLAFPDRHSRVAILSRCAEKRTPDRRLRATRQGDAGVTRIELYTTYERLHCHKRARFRLKF